MNKYLLRLVLSTSDDTDKYDFILPTIVFLFGFALFMYLGFTFGFNANPLTLPLGYFYPAISGVLIAIGLFLDATVLIRLK